MSTLQKAVWHLKCINEMSHGMYRSGPTVPADIITYKHNGKLVYVKPADGYEQALDIAQKEFPEELTHIPRHRISFSITANLNGERQRIRISESAWPGAVARLLRGEVIDVYVRPDPDSQDTHPPPQYLEVPQSQMDPRKSKEKVPLRHSRSNPSSRSISPASNKEPESRNRRSWFNVNPR